MVLRGMILSVRATMPQGDLDRDNPKGLRLISTHINRRTKFDLFFETVRSPDILCLHLMPPESSVSQSMTRWSAAPPVTRRPPPVLGAARAVIERT